MSTGNTGKKERNDVYTAFAVLGLFLLFGFFISDSSFFSSESEAVTDWIEQPIAPAGYDGFPVPHDDESLYQMPFSEEIQPLPKRKNKPFVSTNEADTTLAISKLNTKPRPLIDDKNNAPVLEPIKTVEPKLAIESTTQEEITTPILNSEKLTESEKVMVKPLPKAKEKVAAKATMIEASPRPIISSSAPEISTVGGTSSVDYITSKLPCVWIVGIFKNPNNVKRVVERLRLNKFGVGTGAHEKGTYVGVPCKCSGEESKAIQLREIFSAQPWLLRK